MNKGVNEGLHHGCDNGATCVAREIATLRRIYIYITGLKATRLMNATPMKQKTIDTAINRFDREFSCFMRLEAAGLRCLRFEVVWLHRVALTWNN